MNTSDATWPLGWRYNDDKLRFTRHYVPRSLVARVADSGLPKIELNRTRINGLEKNYTGIGYLD